MFGWKKEKHHTSEREFIGEQSLRQQRLDHELDTLLDQLLSLFPSVPGLMAEILVPSRGNAQLITARIRPDESVALPIRVRRGEGTIGAVFQSGQPFAGSRSDAGRISHSGSRGDVTHLLRTRSLLVIPISSHHRALGVLNLESPRDNTFTRDSLALVQESAAYKSLVDHLTTMTLETLSDDEIARNLVGKLRQQVAFAIDPSDLDSTYYQILQASAQIVNAPEISAGLVLVRDDSLRLAPVTGSRTNSPKQLWAVLASKLGAFNSDPEWKLEDTSIAGRVIENRESEIIPNVKGYPGYRNSGTNYKESSELIVPLVDGDHALGVIGLVSPALNTFTKTDQQHVEEIAKIAVYAIKRGEDILAAKRSELQLRLADELNEDFKQFFPPNVEAIRGLDIRAIRNRMYDKILRWAKEHADADHAAIVLPEIVRDTRTNTQNEAQPHSTSLTYLTVHRDSGEHLDTAPPRWLATEGVTGRAYSSGGTAEEPEIAKKAGSTAVVEYYIDAASEVAAPMKRGDEVIGVLDVESKKDHHFTTAHIRWVEFLARQTALVLIAAELALKTQLELKLERLARDTDRVSQDIREADLDKVRKEVRDPQLLKILTEVCEITGSSVGRILIAMNAYKSPADDAVDVANGVLYFMISTDPSETASDSVRYFPISEGASGTAFRQSREIIFRDEFSREEANYSRRSRDSLSGMILPIFEGSRIVGVVGFEADRKDAYTPDYALVGRRAAAMISRLLVVARLRISRSTTRMLRDFESSMLQLENKTIETFMEEVLQRTALLSDIKDGWGQLILLRPSTDSTTLIADRIFGATYQKDAVSDDMVSNFDPGTSDTREEILGSAFREAIIEQRPVLVLDVSHASTDFHLPRPAQSFICVPLLRPNEITYPSEVDAAPALTTQSATVERAIGLLVVASPSRSEFSEADKEILTPFTQTIVYGLQTLALLGARRELMNELTHDFTVAYPALQRSIRNVLTPLGTALTTDDIASMRQDIQAVNGQIVDLKALVRLTQNMLSWFFDLADDRQRNAEHMDNGADSAHDEWDVVSATDIFRDIEEPISTLAKLKNRRITWVYPQAPLALSVPADTQNLVAAVLFKFLDNAIKKAVNDDIVVTCVPGHMANNTPGVIFRVTNSGQPISQLDRPLLFKLRYRPGSVHGSASTGIGLYQAKLIATRLGGSVGYGTDEVNHNTFWLALPRVETAAE